MAKLCPILLRPHGLYVAGQPPQSMISQARILEWIAIFFSRRSSQPRDQTHVSCIAGGFFIAEPPEWKKPPSKLMVPFIWHSGKDIQWFFRSWSWRGGLIIKNTKISFWSVGKVLCLDCVVLWLHAFAKTQHSILKSMNFTACKLYLSKPDFKNN